MSRLYANTMPFYMRLEHPQILVSTGVLEPIHHGHEEGLNSL